MAVAVRILGPVEAIRDAVKVPIGSAQQRVILAALASAPAASVTDLIDAVWGDAAPRDETRTLMKLVYRLRQVLGPGIIDTDGAAYRLTSETDLAMFDDLCGRAESADAATAVELYDEALRLWRGGALPELAGVGWAEPLRRSLDERRIHVIEERAELMLQLGRHRMVVSELLAHVVAHPMRSRSVGLLARALYRSDRSDEALRALEEHRRRLADETGLEPAPALTELASRIASGSEPTGDRPTSWVPPPARTPLVGRAAQLRLLGDAWTRARDGGSQVVFVEGEPGIGKSRLAAEFVHTLDAPDALVLFGRFREHDDAPLRTLTEALAPVAGERIESSTIIPALVRQTQPVLLVLDDLHWASIDDLRIVERLTSAVAERGLLVVATLRTPGRPEVPDELDRLRRDPLVRLVVLPPLTAVELATLEAAVVPPASRPEELGDVDLLTLTGGNPLYALSVLESGDARTRPASLHAHLEMRVQRLMPATRDLLESASIIGRSFDPAEAGSISGTDGVDESIAEAIRAGLIRTSGVVGGEYEFVHDLVRQELIDLQPMSRRRERHLRAAGPLTDPRDAARAAHHLEQAGPLVEPVQLVTALVRAAERANRDMAFSASEGFARRALALLDANEPSDLSVRAATVLANTLHSANRREEAAALRARFLGDAFRLGGPALANAVIACSEPDPNDTSKSAVGEALLRDALAVIGNEHPAARAALLALLALDSEPFRILTDAKLELIAEASRLLVRVDGSAPTDGLFTALADEWMLVCRTLGGPAEYGRLVYRLGGRPGGPFMRLPFAVNRMTGLVGLGMREGCDELVGQIVEIGRSTDAGPYRRTGRLWQAIFANLDGEFVTDEFVGEVTKSLPPASSGRWFWESIRLWSRIERGDLTADDADTVEATLTAALPFAPLVWPHLAIAAACHAMTGRLDQARRLAEVFLDDLVTVDRHPERPFAWRWLPDVAFEVDDRAAAASLLPYIEPYRGQILVGSAAIPLGAADRSLGILHTILGDYDEAELCLRTALALERGMRSRPLALRSNLALAQLWSRRGGARDGDRARALARTIVREAGELGMVGVQRTAATLTDR